MASKKVKTLRAHSNIHGQHKAGAEYLHADPASDVRFGYVEIMPPDDGVDTKPATPAKAAKKQRAK